MPRSNLAKTITLRVSLVPRLQVYHKEEIKKDPRATNEDFGGFCQSVCVHHVLSLNSSDISSASIIRNIFSIIFV
jgi:hypothetical protein